MTPIPKLVAKFWRTLNNPSAPHGKVDMFHLDDEGGTTVFSLGVSFLEGYDLERSMVTAAEFADRSNRFPKAQQIVGELFAAIRSTASQGNFDENLMRRAVGFELAELIVGARRDIEAERRKCGSAHCANMAEFECRLGGDDVIHLCRRHTESYFPGVPASVHTKIPLR